jgi:hypothetical protein
MATTDYGIDVAGVLDWPDPEELASGPANLANALARRLLTPEGALLDVGDEEPYDSIDLRDWLASHPSSGDLDALNTAMHQVLSQDERVDTVSAVATFTAGVLTVNVSGQGAAGPFAFVLTIDAVSGAQLRVLQ